MANIRAAVLEIFFKSNSGKVQGELSGVNSEVEKFEKQGTKNVSSLEKSLNGLASTAGIVSGTIAGAGAAISKAFQLGEAGAGIQRLETAGYNLAESMDSNMAQIVSSVRAASLNTVSDLDIITSANRAMMLGLGADAQQLGELMQVAAFRARAMGISTTQAFNDIVTGIGRQSPLILDNLGIVFDANQVYADYAENIGDADGVLEEHQKTQALMNATIETGNEMLAAQGGLLVDNAAKYEIVRAGIKNVIDEMKASFSENWMTPFLSAMMQIFAPDKYNEIAQAMAESTDWLAQGTEGYIHSYEDYAEAITRATTSEENFDKYFGLYTGETSELQTAFMSADTWDEYVEGLGLMTEAQFNAMRVQDQYYIAMGEWYQNQTSLTTANEESTLALDAQNIRARILAETYGELKSAQENLANAQSQFGLSIAGDVKSALDAANLSAEDYATALGVIDEQYGTMFARENEMATAIQAAVDEFEKTGDAEAFGEAIGNLQTDFGDLATEVIAAQDEVDLLQLKINELEGKTIPIIIDISQTGTEFGDGGSNDSGNSGNSENSVPQMTAFGTSFTVPAGYPNDSYLWSTYLSSGEHVSVNPSGAGGGGGGQGGNVSLVIEEGAIQIDTESMGEFDIRALAEAIAAEFKSGL